MFVVNARDREGVANFYLAGDSVLQHQNLVLGYETPGLLRFSHFGNDLDTAVEPYSGSPVWVVDTFHFTIEIGKTLYRNGVLINANDQKQPLTSNTGTTLGHIRAFGSSFWFQGDLAEVIVYDRALMDGERSAVETELLERFGIE